MADMRLKTYRAPSMADALVLVKKDLGKEAVILHTRVYKVGTIFGLGGRPQVEVTATIGVNTMPPRRRPQAQPQLAAVGATVGNAVGAQVEAMPAATASAPPPARSGFARAYAASIGNAAKPSINNGPAAPSVPAQSHPAKEVAAIALEAAVLDKPGPRLVPVEGESLRDELAAIKRMVGQVLQTTPTGAAPMPSALLDHYLRLIEAEVSRELADQIVGQLRDELTPAELNDAQAVRQGMLRRLEGLFPSANLHVPPPRPASGRPFTLALVGPTGVGKTTTLAKLAAAHKLRHGKRVGMITCDTYRIAAVEQLRTYANIIGVPLKVVLTPEELRSACAELADCDVILIDTAGRSPGDSARLDELAEFLEAAQPDQTHLVLSSVAGQGSLTRAAERFARLKPDHLIFTKLDEAVNFGLLVNVTARVQAKLPVRLSYVTTGQEVPDDIEPTRAERMARLVLEGALPA